MLKESSVATFTYPGKVLQEAFGKRTSVSKAASPTANMLEHPHLVLRKALLMLWPLQTKHAGKHDHISTCVRLTLEAIQKNINYSPRPKDKNSYIHIL